VTGPARPICLFEIEPASGGARVKFLLSYEPRGLMWLMNGMIQSRMIAEVQNLSVLKSVMEAK